MFAGNDSRGNRRNYTDNGFPTDGPYEYNPAAAQPMFGSGGGGGGGGGDDGMGVALVAVIFIVGCASLLMVFRAPPGATTQKSVPTARRDDSPASSKVDKAASSKVNNALNMTAKVKTPVRREVVSLDDFPLTRELQGLILSTDWSDAQAAADVDERLEGALRYVGCEDRYYGLPRARRTKRTEFSAQWALTNVFRCELRRLAKQGWINPLPTELMTPSYTTRKGVGHDARTSLQPIASMFEELWPTTEPTDRTRLIAEMHDASYALCDTLELVGLADGERAALGQFPHLFDLEYADSRKQDTHVRLMIDHIRKSEARLRTPR